MQDITAHSITCHAEFDGEGELLWVALTSDIDGNTHRISASDVDEFMVADVVRVFRDAAEYYRVFTEMMRTGMCFKMGGPLGMDIAATVLAMWNEYRAKCDDRPPIVRTEAEWEAMSEKREAEAEKSKQAVNCPPLKQGACSSRA